MQVGEFFVNLGIKGSEKTVGAITNVKKGLEQAKDVSIETKAALVGAMYALERLFAASGQAGTGLTNFNSLLGVSAKTLQEYQYAARQMGVANEDVAGTFRTLQGAMTKALTGQGKPAGLARVGMLTGGITQGDLAKFQQNPELLLQRLQQYALKEGNIGLRNETLKSFNLSDSMIAAMARNAFNPAALKKAPAYGDKEFGALDRANIAWSNLGTKIEMAVGHFNARHGGQLVKDIGLMVDAVVKLANALERLAEKTKVFMVLSKAIEGIASVAETTATLLGGTDKEKDALVHKRLQELNKKDTRPLLEKLGLGVGSTMSTAEIVRRGMVPGSHFNPATDKQDVQVNQSLHFHHDGTDAKKTGDSTKQAVKNAFRQIPAQLQGS